MILMLNGDARAIPLADNSMDCVVTSPPYWGLRDYGTARWEGGDAACDHKTPKGGAGDASGKQVTNGGSQAYHAQATCPKCGARRVDAQIGLESSVDAFIANLVAVFREVRRVLKPTGTCWINMGDCYAQGGRGGNPTAASSTLQGSLASQEAAMVKRGMRAQGLKSKDLVGQPWRLAFALQADGWYLRQDIIWAKKNPMPESCRDRATKSHEYIFLLTKRPKYYFNQAAWLEDASPGTHARVAQDVAAQAGSERAHAGSRADRPMKASWRDPHGWADDGTPHNAVAHSRRDRAGANSSMLVDKVPRKRKAAEPGHGIKNNDSMDAALAVMPIQRNRRSVWHEPDGNALLEWLREKHPAVYADAMTTRGSVLTLGTEALREKHFAAFPTSLVEPCIIAGCPPGGTVFDPFGGTGTTMLVANRLDRNGVMLELSAAYIEIAKRRVFPDVTRTRDDATDQKLLFA